MEKRTQERPLRVPLPAWSIPLLLVILGILLLIGNLSATMSLVVGIEVVASCVYVLWRGRREPSASRAPANLLSLFPGHLLLLLGVSLLDAPDGLVAVWLVLPILTIVYEEAGSRMRAGWARTSILVGGYAILWVVLFALLERLIAIGRALDLRGEIIAASAIGVFGLLFITLGIYRHVRAGKE